jgi:colicin import membrane protein
MALDPTLPKDAVAAQQLLEQLMTKDLNEEICRYPTCSEPRKAPEKGGKPPAYCSNPLHTPQRNLRARAHIENVARGLPSVSLDTEQPVTVLAIQSLRDKALAELEQFSEYLGIYIAALREFSDPEIAAAQIEAAQHRADAMIAASQETVETERSLRLSAEHSRDTAQKDAQAARQEAALAIAKMQESEERARQQQEQYQHQIAALQKEHAEALEAIRLDAQNQIASVKASASQEIALAQAATTEAQKEARSAEQRAHDAETEARLAVTNAEQRVTEAYMTLKREQDEVARLRQERDTQAETDRKEIQQLRGELAAARVRAADDRAEIQQLRASLQSATKRADDDHAEIQQLRASLLHANKRADDLALSNDGLRTQLTQIQEARREKNEKEE